MSHIVESSSIAGVYIVQLSAYGDNRGRFLETFRCEWFPQVSWEALQTNRSDSRQGVLRGLHYHHHQVDYWYAPSGVLRAGLVDLRSSSPTYLATLTVPMGDEQEVGLFIPAGVAHGFAALTHVTLIYVVNRYYDGGRDEFGVAWNDPELGLDWGIDQPILSERDAANPLLQDLPAEQLPE